MTTAQKHSMRGLGTYITDIRNTSSKEDEEKRVQKELAKIRKKFKEGKVIGYDRRKYLCKLMYSYLLGYEIDFAHIEALNLLSSLKFQEKVVGYLSVCLLINEQHSLTPLLVQSFQNDLMSRNEYHQSLALNAISNIGGKEIAESVAPIVQKILISKGTKSNPKKKAALATLRLARKVPDLITADTWVDKFSALLDEPDLGILTSVMSLLLGLIQMNSAGYEPLVKKVIGILNKILINREYTKEYVYYQMANPWLQVKLLKFLSYYPPCEDKMLRKKLSEIFHKILDSSDIAKGQTQNHKNALNAVLFETISLVIHLDDDREMIRQAGSLLGRFISSKETNIKYLALESMARLAALDNETLQIAKKNQETIILALRDPDISIRKRALNLLYGLCDLNNSKSIVAELLSYLATADFAIREELVIKIAILAEKFASHYSWYVDIILQLISLSGDFVSDEIWFRVIQIVTNHEDIQEYAARTVFEVLKNPTCHETAVKVGGYLLGEFGHLIVEFEGASPRNQFDVLYSKFPTASVPVKALLLSTFIKLLNPYPELSDSIRSVFRTHQDSIDTEIQQRACEYLKLSHGSEELLQTVWDVMPAFPDKEDNQIGNAEEEEDENNNSNSNSTSLVELPSQSTSNNTNDDPFGLQLIDNNSLSLVPATNSLSDAEMDAFFKKSCMRPDGIIYEDSILKIGFKSEYSKGQGRIALYFINLTNSKFNSFNVTPAPNDGIKLNLQPVASVIEAKSQIQQLGNFTCVNAFSEPPTIHISFNGPNGNVSLKIKLPIVIARFVEPLKLNGPEFFQKWRQITAGPPLEQQAIVKATGAIDMDALGKTIASVFNFNILKGVDPNVHNLTAAGNLYTTSAQVICLLRIETNPTALMYRVTIRTPSPAVSEPLKDVLVSQLN